MPSVEIDIDSLPSDAFGYADLVQMALVPLAARTPHVRATVYVRQGPSVNFGNPAYCAFFGVAGRQSVLEALYTTFLATPGVRVRYSDEIVESQTIRQYHLEDGEVWRPNDGSLWAAGTEYENHGAADEERSEAEIEKNPYDANDSDRDEVGEGILVDDPAAPQRRIELPARFRAARSDASVGSICRKIEEIFGLPEGSVALRGPERKSLRVDATIRTLRRRWEQS